MDIVPIELFELLAVLLGKILGVATHSAHGNAVAQAVGRERIHAATVLGAQHVAVARFVIVVHLKNPCE